MKGIAILDHRRTNPVEGLLPRPAVLSSQGWTDLRLEVYHQPKFAIAEHQHTLHVIALGIPTASNSIAAGFRWLDGQRRREERPASGIAVIPAGCTHRCSWDSTAQFMVLALEPKLLKQVGRDWIHPDHIELTPTFMEADDDFIRTLFTALEAEAELGGLGSPLLVDSLKVALAVHLLRHYCTTQPRLASGTSGGLSLARRSQVKAYIDAHLHRNLTLVELAGVAHISPAYFARLFKQSEGITPHQYILQRRVERAQILLRRSQFSLAEIAASVGFCDQSHLTRCFKRLTGATPTQFRHS